MSKRGIWIIIGAVLLLLVVVVFLLTRGQKPTASKVTLTVWSPFDEEKTYQQLSSKFLSSHSNVTFNFEYIAATDAKDYESQVVNAIANGKGPDIWLARNDWIPKHIDKSAPAKSSNNFDPIAVAKQNVLGNLIDLNTFNKKLYGMPMSADTLAVIYNQTLYNQATSSLTGAQQTLAQKIPATWDDLKSQTALVDQTKNGVVTRSGIALGTAANTFASSDVLSAFLIQEGVNSVLSSDNKAVAFNLPQISGGETKLPATDALNFYTSFATPSQSNFSWTGNLGDPVQAFLDQKTDAIIGYYSTLQQILAKNPSFNIQIAPLVQPNTTAKRVDFGITWTSLVNKNSANKDLAWDYLYYLSDQQRMSDYAAATNKLSIVTGPSSQLSAQLVGSGAATNIFRGQFSTAQSFIKPEWQFVDQTFQDMINLVVNNGQSSQTAVDTGAASFKKQFIGD